jgi:hypothetical protein
VAISSNGKRSCISYEIASSFLLPMTYLIIWVMLSLSKHRGRAFAHVLRQAQDDLANVISPSEASDFKTRNDMDDLV